MSLPPPLFRLLLSLFCLGCFATFSHAQAPGHKPPVSKEEQADLDAMNAKVNDILISEIKFDQTPLPDAVEKLRAAARDLDKATDVKDRGVNIFIKLKGTATTPTTPITLDLKSVSLKDALEAVSKQAHLSMKIERYAVTFSM